MTPTPTEAPDPELEAEMKRQDLEHVAERFEKLADAVWAVRSDVSTEAFAALKATQYLAFRSADALAARLEETDQTLARVREWAESWDINSLPYGYRDEFEELVALLDNPAPEGNKIAKAEAEAKRAQEELRRSQSKIARLREALAELRTWAIEEGWHQAEEIAAASLGGPEPEQEGADDPESGASIVFKDGAVSLEPAPAETPKAGSGPTIDGDGNFSHAADYIGWPE